MTTSKSENMIRIMVVDDHKLFRSGLISLLQTQPNIFVVGEAADGEECEEVYFSLNPNILLIDIEMPKRNGIETIRSIREIDKNVKAIVLTQHENESIIARAYEAGAKGYMNKDIILGELLYAINTVLSGNIYFGPTYTVMRLEELVNKLNEDEERYDPELYKLTPRELEVLMLIADGLTSLEIADSLNIKKRTVDSIRKNIADKCNFSGGHQLIKFAVWCKKNRHLFKT